MAYLYVKIIDELQIDLDETGLSGELKIGAISTALSRLLPGTIQYLTTTAPNINLQIFTGTSAYFYKQLLAKKVDVIIISSPAFICPKYLDLTHLYFEQLGFMCSTNSELGINKSLLSKPYIQYDRSAWGSVIADSYLVNNNIAVKSLCEIDALESIVRTIQRDNRLYCHYGKSRGCSE